jgi:uncharacterized protein (DUF58 family)
MTDLQAAPADSGPASARLRQGAEALGANLPPLLAEARHLAAALQMGAHGRRRAGTGDEFWQYRPAQPGDEARLIDWRRSARSDQHYLREKEWQAAQAVHLWVDRAPSMRFASGAGLADKADRASLLALALAIVLERGGERIGLAGALPLRAGLVQLNRIAAALADTADGEGAIGADVTAGFAAGSRALFLSDFFSPHDRLAQAVLAAADRGVKGALVQVLDPAEENFPFAGRTVFENMTGVLRHETKEAGGLRRRYLDRLAERRDHLQALARQAGWALMTHRTDLAPMPALLWIYTVIGGRA